MAVIISSSAFESWIISQRSSAIAARVKALFEGQVFVRAGGFHCLLHKHRIYDLSWVFLSPTFFLCQIFFASIKPQNSIERYRSGIFCCLDLVIFSDTRGQHPGHPPPVTVPISRQKLLDRTCCLNSGMVTDRGEKNRSWFPPDEFFIFSLRR